VALALGNNCCWKVNASGNKRGGPWGIELQSNKKFLFQGGNHRLR